MRLSLGGFSQVIMTDRWFQELRAGRAYARYNGQGPTAGNYSHVGIKNPAGSGKQVIVAQLAVVRSVAGWVLVSMYDPDLTTDVGALYNLLSGTAAASTHMRKQDNAGLLGTNIDQVYCPANTRVIVWPSWGPELGPGTGILVVPDAVNNGVSLGVLVNEV